MILTSPAFDNNEPIPKKYTCDATGVNPPLEFFEVPQETDSLVLLMTDPDAPGGTFYHWVLWNINPGFDGIGEGNIVAGSVEGKNTTGERGYFAPCPPAGGTHHYVFTLYAITGNLFMAEDVPANQIEELIHDRVVATATLTGTYERSDS